MKRNSKAFDVRFLPQPSKNIPGFETLRYLLGCALCYPGRRMPVILYAVPCRRTVAGSAGSAGIVSPVETVAEHP